jgi:hypothetical protein
MVSANQMLVRDTPCESVTSTVAIASAVSLVSTTAKDVTSIPIPAGDWEIFGNCAFVMVPGTVIVSETSSFSTTSNAQGSIAATYQAGFGASKTGQAAADVHALPNIKVSLTSNATYYLVADSNFSASTMKAAGTITAKRYK